MRVLGALETAIRGLRRREYECSCGAAPRLDGTVEHGRGCYEASPDGGGSEHIGHEVADVLYELLQDLGALEPVIRALAYGRLHHGPDARGSDGPCGEHCVKCAWQAYLRFLPRQVR